MEPKDLDFVLLLSSAVLRTHTLMHTLNHHVPFGALLCCCHCGFILGEMGFMSTSKDFGKTTFQLKHCCFWGESKTRHLFLKQYRACWTEKGSLSMSPTESFFQVLGGDWWVVIGISTRGTAISTHSLNSESMRLQKLDYWLFSDLWILFRFWNSCFIFDASS